MSSGDPNYEDYLRRLGEGEDLSGAPPAPSVASEAPPGPGPDGAAPASPAGSSQKPSEFLKQAMSMRGGSTYQAPSTPSVPSSPQMTPEMQKAVDKTIQSGTYGSNGASAGDIASVSGSGL